MNTSIHTPHAATNAQQPNPESFYARALHEFQCYHGDPIATIQQALALEPNYVRGHLFHGWLHALSTEAGAEPVVQADLLAASQTTAASADGAGTPQDHPDAYLLQALQQFLQGQWAAASDTLAHLSQRWPLDSFALSVGHLVDFLRGDSTMLRDRIAQALPAWSRTSPGYHALLGMLAFGHEECGDMAQAEAKGREALELEPTDAWAHHAVAHVLEMQGRTQDGIRFMREREHHWAEGGFFAHHNYWHWAMFHLDRGEIAEALALFDGPMQGGRSPLAVDVVDAASLLWRLRLLGADSTERWQQVAVPCAQAIVQGHYSFNDFHAHMVRVGAKKPLLQSPAYPPAGDHLWLHTHVGTPLCAAIEDCATGLHASAVERLLEVRPKAQRFGGSHAQRDLIDLTLLDAALRAGFTTLARTLLQQRLTVKPHSFINQCLQARLAASATNARPTRPAGASAEAAPLSA